MSLSALSSALSLSSRSESSSQKRKTSELSRGDISCDISISGSSLSSEGAKSICQDGPLPLNLLGNHDSATDTSSSSGFPSLALSNSSLSEDQHIFMSMSSTSSLSFEQAPGLQQEHVDTFHQYEVETQEENSPPSTPERLVVSRQIVLENVEYVSSLLLASSSYTEDLSTMDEPITKEVAKDVFCRRIAPVENVPVDGTPSEDASTRHKGHQSAAEHEGEPEYDIEKGWSEDATTAMEVQIAFPFLSRVLRRRTKLELFFLSVIVVSSSVLVVLLIVVLK